MFATRTSLAAAFLTAAVAFVVVPSGDAAVALGETTYTFDVAMDGTSFFFEGDTTPSGVPAKGTPFVVEGYIYPEGTFEKYGPLSGVNLDGSPEFPEEVLGLWSCRGWHLLDGDAPSGPVVVTNQYFDFSPERPGAQTIVTDGIELADFDVTFERAITGGTGRFRNLQGAHTQTYVGGDVSATGGFNAVMSFTAEN
ncbi:MAG: hypothetical protein AAF682_20850 [Planctomycetota bacterium]